MNPKLYTEVTWQEAKDLFDNGVKVCAVDNAYNQTEKFKAIINPILDFEFCFTKYKTKFYIKKKK